MYALKETNVGHAICKVIDEKGGGELVVARIQEPKEAELLIGLANAAEKSKLKPFTEAPIAPKPTA